MLSMKGGYFEELNRLFCIYECTSPTRMYNLIGCVDNEPIIPEKLVKSRQNGEKRFLKSHCWASCGVAVGNKF